VRTIMPGVRLSIYGSPTPFVDVILELARSLKVDDIVSYHGMKAQDEIAQAIVQTDLGIIPNRRSPFTELNFPTRIFEYLAMHCPVIAPSTRGIMDYFGPEQLLMFEPDNVDDLVAKIIWVWEHPREVEGFIERGNQVYRKHLWTIERNRFLDVVGGLVRV
jgi:glycosyltransferase involved in cell wall biosynthesis